MVSALMLKSFIYFQLIFFFFLVSFFFFFFFALFSVDFFFLASFFAVYMSALMPVLYFVCLFVLSFRPHLWHMEVPRLGVQLEL